MKINGDLGQYEDQLIALLECEQASDVQQPIHFWVQKFGETRFVIFLYQKYDQAETAGFRTHYILNANQLYTTRHRMPRSYKIHGNDFEYVDSKWKMISTSCEARDMDNQPPQKRRKLGQSR